MDNLEIEQQEKEEGIERKAKTRKRMNTERKTMLRSQRCSTHCLLKMARLPGFITGEKEDIFLRNYLISWIIFNHFLLF